VAVGLLAGALAVFGVALAPPSGATATVTTERLAGATRYGTAAAISGDEAFAAPKSAIVATGENYPDALAASTLAGANAPTPIILTQTSTYTTDAKSALGALKTKGVTKVTIVGGTAAVSDSVKTAIEGDGFTVTRVAGTNRYETAAAIAKAADAIAPAAAVGGLDTALIATGLNFPDALAGGPAAYQSRLPLLLVSDTVPQATKDAITSLGIKKAVVLGGTAAVSDAVAAELKTQTGNDVQRLAGTNRYGTGAAVGDYEISTLKFAATAAVLATGNNFPDALAAGPLGGQLQAPIALTSSLPAETQAWLDAHSNTIAKLYVSGGTAAIDDATVAAAVAAAQNVANDTSGSATSRPELQTASIVQTNATQGTTIKYCFDEAITGGALGAATLFHVYTSTDTQDPGGVANAAFVDATDTKCANVTFPAITTTSVAGSLTLATVDAGAVTGTTGGAADQNPIGDAPLGSTGTTTFTAGITAAPDLASVSNFRDDPTAPSTNTLVDFLFDEATYRLTAAGGNDYHLVQTAGNAASDTACNYVSGDGTTTHTVTCVDPASGAFSSSNVMRAYVSQGSVTDSPTGVGGNTNPLEAADVSGSGSTDTPDLASCTFQPDVKGTDATTAIDRVIFTFDEPVNVAGANTTFNVYQASGAEVDGQAAGAPYQGPTRSTANDVDVSVDYVDGTLSTAVGCSVEAGAVAEATNATATNRPDEVGVSNSGVALTAGRTDGPDLIAVIVTASKDAFGTVTGYTATYVFDEDIATPITGVSADFMLYDADGTALTCTGAVVVGSTEETDATATCTAFAGATLTQLAQAVLGTVDDGTVTEQSGGTLTNPEGASAASHA